MRLNERTTRYQSRQNLIDTARGRVDILPYSRYACRMIVLNFKDHPSISGKWDRFELSRQNSRSWNVVGVNQDRILGARVLELGSNEGRMSFAALQYGAKSVVGVDRYKDNVNLCKQNCPDASFIQSDIRDFLHTTDLEFDVVICSGVIYHLDEHMRVFEGLGRAVRKGAHTVILETAVRDPDTPKNPCVSPLGHTMIWPLEKEVVEGAKLNGFPVTGRSWDTSQFPLCKKGYDGCRRIYEHKRLT